MRVYILRHAEAAPGEPDSERPLTPKGEADLQRLGEHLRKNDAIRASRILHSDLLRARQSASLFAKAAQLGATPSVFPGLRPEDDPRALLESLPADTENLLLVGHNPHLSSLLALMTTGRYAHSGLHMKKCHLACCYSPEAIKAGAFRLKWMIGPNLA